MLRYVKIFALSCEIAVKPSDIFRGHTVITKTSQECEPALTSKHQTLFWYFFLSFSFFSAHHSYQMSMVSSLKSHKLCQNSKVAMTHTLNDEGQVKSCQGSKKIPKKTTRIWKYQLLPKSTWSTKKHKNNHKTPKKTTKQFWRHPKSTRKCQKLQGSTQNQPMITPK